MSKMYFMSGNTLRLGDFGMPLLAQWIAAAAIMLHGISSLFHYKMTILEKKRM